MSSKSSNDGLPWFLIFIVACGILTELLVIIPIKIVKWLNVDKDMRGPFFKSISPMGRGFISFIGIYNCLIYGVFWFLFFVIITNAVQQNFNFCNFYTEQYITLTNETIRKFNGDTLFIWIMIFTGTFAFLGLSIYVIICDINGTDYEREYDGTVSLREQAELAIREEEQRRIQKIENEKQVAIYTKSLNETKIEELPF